MNFFDFLLRLSVCFLLGVLIGLERQYRRKTAGIRTITLVSLGAFLFVSISNLSPAGDVTRIAAQVVSGIGFLGAGVILRDGTNIRGLNTAATLWCSAAIGTLTALGLIPEAIIGVIYILLTNVVLRFISRKMMEKMPTVRIARYSLTVVCSNDKEMIVKNMLIQKLKSLQTTIRNFSTIKLEEKIKIEAQLDIEHDSIDSIENVINRICLEPGVSSVDFTKIANYTDDDDDDYEVK